MLFSFNFNIDYFGFEVGLGVGALGITLDYPCVGFWEVVGLSWSYGCLHVY